MMDYKFPRQLFPSFYNCGPPNLVPEHNAGGWGCYGGVIAQGGSGALSSWTFTSRRQVEGEVWRQTEPVPVPLFSPRKVFQEYLTPPDPMDFLSHMQNFFMDNGLDAFRCTSELLGDNFFFRKAKKKEKYRQGSINMWRTKCYINRMQWNRCPVTYRSKGLHRFSCRIPDIVHDIPPELLGSLLYDELMERRDRMQLSEMSTGGALAYVPLSQSQGCLLYPGGLGVDRLNFHKVALESCCVDGSSKPVSFQLKAPIRQISCCSLLGCVAVRSDYLCGVWRFSERTEPCLLQVVNTAAAATCVSVSPHVLGEVLVASESGAANLWMVGRGIQEVRMDESNLYFNAKSPWRWCEFSAHPRVMVYADRTGAELTDLRVKALRSSHTLFRISSASDCLSGERLLLCRYLGDVHSFHHLITTQHSAYVMDERFPCVPMLKCDHMMQAPPLYCHVASDQGTGGTTKVLLGSHSSQEITLLQYSGGRLEACSSRGAPQALLRPTDSLRHLPVQIPHRHQTAAQRLASPAAGLTCFQKKGGAADVRMCVLQLTEAGDIFYQILDRSGDPAPRIETQTSEQLQISDPMNYSDLIAPSAAPETPDRIHLDSEDEGRPLKQPPVSDNEEAGLDQERREQELAPPTIGCAAANTWKVWLLKLRLTGPNQNPDSLSQQNLTVQTTELLHAAHGGAAVELDEQLRQDLKGCMRRRSLLLNGATSVTVPGPVPVPALVNAEAWTDALSDRLTAAWQREDGWQAWWRDQLGTNRKAKAEALRRKRRRQKEARRAEGRRLQLSGSFNSSISYQTDLDELSESTGWSSAVSQLSGDDVLSRLAAVLQSGEDSALPATETPDLILTATPQKGPPSSPPDTARASQRSRRLEDDIRSSWWGSQSKEPPPLPSSSSSSWFPGSQSESLRLGFGSLGSSQASHSQRGPSQASQPKRKKSRMGF